MFKFALTGSSPPAVSRESAIFPESASLSSVSRDAASPGGPLTELSNQAQHLLRCFPLRSPAELNTLSRESLTASVRGCYSALHTLVSKFGEYIPALGFHGSDRPDGISGILKSKTFESSQGLSGGGYTTIVGLRSRDNHVFVNDLINAARVACDYGTNGVIAFAVGSLLDHSYGFKSYRAMLQSDWALSSDEKRLREVCDGIAMRPGGMHATELKLTIPVERFDSILLGATRFERVKDNHDAPLDRLKIWCIQDLKGMFVLTSTLARVACGEQTTACLEAALPLEENYAGLFRAQRSPEGSTRYTYPDGKDIIVEASGPRFGEKSPLISLRRTAI